jgi:hypothetical protein
MVGVSKVASHSWPQSPSSPWDRGEGLGREGGLWMRRDELEGDMTSSVMVAQDGGAREGAEEEEGTAHGEP